MDKFQSELLAQLKEHNRLTKELVKIERANLELAKDINNKKKGHWIWSLADNGWADHTCSECGFCENTDIHVKLDWKYCPKCGTEMEVE